MIALTAAIAATTGLVVLAGLDGGLPAEDEPPNSDAGGAATHTTVQHELIRFAAAATSVIAGGALDVVLLRNFATGVTVSALAFLIGVVMAAILIQTEVAVAKRMSRQFRASVSTGAHRLPVLRSLVHALSALGERLAALVSPKGGSADEQEASDQFSSVLSTEADMSKDEEKLIRGAISLPRRTVRDVMVPRLAIVGVEMGTPWSEMLDRVRSSEHSRLPAYRESLDDVVGVIVAKDLLPYAITGKAPAGGWESLVRPASFVPATKAVADQLREFRSSRTHMAIVVDEYGGTAGILTIEDVLEEVVGEIRDEHDVEEPPVVSESGSRFWVSGRLPVDELEEIIGERLDEVQATTVGGLVFERKGKVPRVGEELVWGNFRVVVERMKRRAVDRVYLERLSDREKVE